MPIKVDNIYSLLAVLIIALVPTIPAVLSYLQGLENGKANALTNRKVELLDARAAEAKVQIAKVDTKVDGVHILVNSGLAKIIEAKDDLIEAQRTRAVRAEGQVDNLPGTVQDQSDAAAQAHNAERAKEKL